MLFLPLLLCLLAIPVCSQPGPPPQFGGFINISPQKLANLEKEEPNFAIAWAKVKDIIYQSCGIGLGRLLEASYQVIEGVAYRFTAETQYGHLKAQATVQYWNELIQISEISFINFNSIEISSPKTSPTPASSLNPAENLKTAQTSPSSILPKFETIQPKNLQSSLKQQCAARKKLKQKLSASFKMTIGAIIQNNTTENKNQPSNTSAVVNEAGNGTGQNSTSPQQNSAQQVQFNGNQTNGTKNNGSEQGPIKALSQQTSISSLANSQSKVLSSVALNLQLNNQNGDITSAQNTTPGIKQIIPNSSLGASATNTANPGTTANAAVGAGPQVKLDPLPPILQNVGLAAGSTNLRTNPP